MCVAAAPDRALPQTRRATFRRAGLCAELARRTPL
jgi:hypothetical protein